MGGGAPPPNFYDTESVLNGLEDSFHLALNQKKRKLVCVWEREKNGCFQLSSPVDWKLGNYKQSDQSLEGVCSSMKRSNILRDVREVG